MSPVIVSRDAIIDLVNRSAAIRAHRNPTPDLYVVAFKNRISRIDIIHAHPLFVLECRHIGGRPADTSPHVIITGPADISEL